MNIKLFIFAIMALVFVLSSIVNASMSSIMLSSLQERNLERKDFSPFHFFHVYSDYKKHFKNAEGVKRSKAWVYSLATWGLSVAALIFLFLDSEMWALISIEL